MLTSSRDSQPDIDFDRPSIYMLRLGKIHTESELTFLQEVKMIP